MLKERGKEKFWKRDEIGDVIENNMRWAGVSEDDAGNQIKRECKTRLADPK